MKTRVIIAVVAVLIAIGGSVSAAAALCERQDVHPNRVRCEAHGEGQIGRRLHSGVREDGF
jgi:hypothetical protein